ncbi:MAG: hypothetical protein EZS28_026902, partial [Streblomastix strix]
MERSTYRPDLTEQFGTMAGSDVSTIIPSLIQDLESDVTNLHIPAIRQILNIVIDNRESKDLAQKFNLIPLLNKFAGNIEKNEQFVLSTTILHVIGVRNGSDDKTILAGAATDSIIQTIFSPDEKASKSGSKALCDLIEENEIIRHSLMTTGFIQKVQHAFANNQQSSSSSSSSQTENITPNHVKSGLLDVILKLVTTVGDLQPIVVLIPILNELKDNEEKEIVKKYENILGLLNSKCINSDSSESSKDEDQKIQQLEEQNRQMDEENNMLEDENLKLKKEIEKIRLEYPQVIPHEFNVVNSLTGLGPDILTDLLSEMQHIEDVIQLVGVNKKALNLKIHPRFIQILEQISRDKDYPIEINNPDLTDIDITDVDEVMKKITKKKAQYSTISFDQILESGIWVFETQFTLSQLGFVGVGIIQESCNIPANCFPFQKP